MSLQSVCRWFAVFKTCNVPIPFISFCYWPVREYFISNCFGTPKLKLKIMFRKILPFRAFLLIVGISIVCFGESVDYCHHAMTWPIGSLMSESFVFGISTNPSWYVAKVSLVLHSIFCIKPVGFWCVAISDILDEFSYFPYNPREVLARLFLRQICNNPLNRLNPFWSISNSGCWFIFSASMIFFSMLTIFNWIAPRNVWTELLQSIQFALRFIPSSSWRFVAFYGQFWPLSGPFFPWSVVIVLVYLALTYKVSVCTNVSFLWVVRYWFTRKPSLIVLNDRSFSSLHQKIPSWSPSFSGLIFTHFQ